MPRQKRCFAVEYIPDLEQPSSVLTLDEIRKQLPQGHWRHSSEFEDVGVSLEYNLSPRTFWALESADQALMIAYRRVYATMEAYERLVEDRKQQKGAKKERA